MALERISSTASTKFSFRRASTSSVLVFGLKRSPISFPRFTMRSFTTSISLDISSCRYQREISAALNFLLA